MHKPIAMKKPSIDKINEFLQENSDISDDNLYEIRKSIEVLALKVKESDVDSYKYFETMALLTYREGRVVESLDWMQQAVDARGELYDFANIFLNEVTEKNRANEEAQRPTSRWKLLPLTILLASLITICSVSAYVYNKKFKTHITFENQTTSIPFQVIKTDTASLDKGVEQVTVEGSTGEKQTTYEIRTRDGRTTKQIASTSVISEPVNKQINVGTYVEPSPTYISTSSPSYRSYPSTTVPSFRAPITCNTTYNTYGSYFDPTSETRCY